MRAFSAFSWLSLQYVVKHWPRGCIWNRLAFGRLRVGMCVLSLRSWVCLCHCWVMCVSHSSADGRHDLQMTQRSESTFLMRLCCGVWRSIAGGVVVRFCCLPPVIAIWFVFSNGFSDVSVPFVFR